MRPAELALLCLAAGALALPAGAAKPVLAKARAGKAVTAPARWAPVSPEDQGLADWSLQPFSDLASHGVLWRRGTGLLAWRLCSARAFGSLAAAPHGAKLLFDASLDVLVDGGDQPRFASLTAAVEDWPTWVDEKSQDGDLQAEAITVFSATDGVVAAVNLTNAGTKALRLRPRLHLKRNGNGLRGSAECSARYPAVWLTLDRSQALGRRLVEAAGVWMGGRDWTAELAGKPLAPLKSQELGEDGLDLTLSWAQSEVLQPGQSLRIPVLLAWGSDLDAVQKAAENQWLASALPKGLAYGAARQRWANQVAALPAVPTGRERLLHRAVLDLCLSDYGAEAALGADAFSAQKGLRDAFFSVDSPLAALGWAELDASKAEAAVLDLAGFSAAAPAAVPPYTGEEKLPWDAAGLPLNALVAWELYHRDPQGNRAAQFFSAFGERLRNECAWWPPNRDGDGNGLYAFARDEEKPPYLQRSATPVPAVQALSPTGQTPADLESWSLALTSLVAWQMQAAGALAQAVGKPAESEQLLAIARHSQEALHAQAWDLSQGAAVQGMDGLWPLTLGLESDESRVDQELGTFLKKWDQKQDFWIENGVWEPWRVYFAAKTLAAYGHLDVSAQISAHFLDTLDALRAFPSEIKADGSFQGGDSAATAACILEFLLEREQQEIFLTHSTLAFTARWIQFRSLDGSFYMKRTKLPEKNAAYAPIKIETLGQGTILGEGAMVLSCPEALELEIQSENGVDISRAAKPTQLVFKQAHNVVWKVPASQRVLIRFDSEDKRN